MSENAAAAQTAPDTSNANPQNQDDGQVVDYSEILARHQSELARTGKTVESLKAELDKSHGVIGRVQKAFSGEEEKPLSPYQQRMQEYDDLGQYMSENGTAEKYPLTDKLGKHLINMGKQAEARAEKLEQELAEMKAQLKRQQNPAWQGLERAGHIMEGMVEDGLEQMYGKDPSARGIRAAQFNAVTARINEEIKDLMQNDPEALLKVQRNPKIMRNMVNQFMAEMLPPKVRTMLDEERIKNEPMTSRDLYQAFSEAREQWEEAQKAGDERAEQEYSNLMTSIRHDILAAQQESRRGGNPERPSLNQLFRR